MISYYYIVVEFGQTGYLLAKNKYPPRLREVVLPIEQQHIDTLKFIKSQKALGISNTEIIIKLNPILSYPIQTAKAEIVIEEDENVLMTMNRDFIGDMYIYLLIAHIEISNFSNLSRVEPSLYGFYSSTIKDENGEGIIDLLNLN